MKTQAIIAAAGIGERLGSNIRKPFILLKGTPLVVYSLQVFEQCPLIEGLVVVAHRQNIADFEKVIQRYRFKKPLKIIEGGETRCASVSRGLKALDRNTQLVVIHDAARPLISCGVVESAIAACRDVAGVIVAVPVKSTVKRVDPQSRRVRETLPRQELWEVQTPQVFHKDVILRAHQTVRDNEATDDASLVERMREPIRVVEGEYRNIKITTPEDLVVAERLLAQEAVRKIGKKKS